MVAGSKKASMASFFSKRMVRENEYTFGGVVRGGLKVIVDPGSGLGSAVLGGIASESGGNISPTHA